MGLQNRRGKVESWESGCRWGVHAEKEGVVCRDLGG